MTDIAGRVVLVTGAASGIGAACAAAFSRAGARALVLCDIDAGGLPPVCARVERAGSTSLPLEMDVTDPASVRDALAEAESRCGSVDVVVNSAGVGVFGTMEGLTDDDWRRVIDINLWGTINVDRAAYALMSARGSGHIVNVSSANGIYSPMPYLAPYVTSKFGVVGLSEALMLEGLGRGVRVTCVCPGNVKTPIYKKTPMRGFSEGARSLTSINALVAERPERTAAQVVKAVEKDRFIVVTTPVARASAFARCHFQRAWFAYTRVFTFFTSKLAARYRTL